jgi:hypothetical protein
MVLLGRHVKGALTQAYQNNPQLNRSARRCAPPMKPCRRRCRAIGRAQPDRHAGEQYLDT